MVASLYKSQLSANSSGRFNTYLFNTLLQNAVVFKGWRFLAFLLNAI